MSELIPFYRSWTVLAVTSNALLFATLIGMEVLNFGIWVIAFAVLNLILSTTLRKY